MPTGLRGGTQAHWRVWGDMAPEILLIHCTLAHSGAWTGLAPLLERPALAFDMPGHGRSGDWDQSRDLHDQTTEMAASFLADAPGPMDVIGHSFGGTVALRLALERPDLVRRLVLIEPVYFVAAAGSAAFRAHTELMSGFRAKLEAQDSRAAARAFTEHWGTGAAWDALRPDQQEAMAARIHLVAAQDTAIFEDRPKLLAPGRLEACAQPTLLMQGAQAIDVIGAVNESLADRLPNARRATIAGAGHMAPITHPAPVAETLSAFLSAPTPRIGR